MSQQNPTAEWTGRLLLEAIPGNGNEPRYLIRDRDGVYGHEFTSKAELIGLRDIKITPKSPWQNPFCERVIGSIRRECTNHIIALGERHLVRTLCKYARWYNTSRPHVSLDRNAPEPRTIQHPSMGHVRSEPVLGGLHHRYLRVA